MQTLWQDLRYGARMLFKHPGFTLIAVITLSLGIGANTAIFSVVNAVLLRALSFPEAGQLVAVGATKTANRMEFNTLSFPDFADLKAQNQVFERLAAYQTRGFTLLVDEGAIRLRGAVVEADLFPLLKVTPLYGRLFIPAEDAPGGGRAVILSHSLWRNRFSADPNIVGKTAQVNGESYSIAGVMPSGFAFPIQSEPVELWANFAVDREGAQAFSAQRGNHYLNAVGRLKAGATVAQAEAQLVSLASQLERQYPNDNHGISVRVAPLLEQMLGASSRSLWLIFAAVGFVLLIACANVAGLLLARAARRRREIGLRAALGASRSSLLRQSLTESLLLALLGGGAGVLLASFGTDALLALTPQDIPRLAEARLDGRVLLFTFALATLTGVLMGIVPAWQASRIDLQSVLREGGRGLTGARVGLRGVLVVAQVAIAVVLLIGAGLLLQSFARLLRVNPGFDAEHLLTLRAGLPAGQYKQPQRVAELHEQLLPELARCRAYPPTAQCSLFR